jgi:hypothetical protein
MAETQKRGSLLLPFVSLVLAFGVVVLLVRVTALQEERDEAVKRADAFKADKEAVAAERNRANEALAKVERDKTAAEGLEKLALADLGKLRKQSETTVAAVRDEVDRLKGLLMSTRKERDEAAAARLELTDRVGELEGLLATRESELEKAKKDLRRLREPTIVEVEERRLGNPDSRVRAQAVARLGELRNEPGALDALRRALRESRDLAEARAALRAAGPEGARRLAREEVRHEAVVVRQAACSALEDLTTLRTLLADREATVRAAAATRIGELGRKGMAEALWSRKSDGDARVRAAIALALIRLEAWDRAAAFLGDEDRRVARSALAGWTASGRPLPDGIDLHPDLKDAVALSNRILSLRSGSD